MAAAELGKPDFDAFDDGGNELGPALLAGEADPETDSSAARRNLSSHCDTSKDTRPQSTGGSMWMHIHAFHAENLRNNYINIKMS
jgi:hypothetical protein